MSTLKHKTIRSLLFGCFLLVLHSLHAGKIKYQFGLGGNDLQTTTQFSVEDDWYNYMQAIPSWPSEFTNHDVTNRIIFHYTGQDKVVYNTPWNLTANFNIEAYDANGNIMTNFTTNQTLQIDFDPISGYTDKDLFVFKGAHRVIVKDLAITGMPSIPGDVFMDIEIDVERYFTFNRTQTPTVGHRNPDFPLTPFNPSTDKQIEIYWNYIQGAEHYDLEWVWIDAETALTYQPSSFDDIKDLKFNRVSIPGNTYKLNLSYDKGKIYYRVRGVGRYGTDFSHLQNGLWSNNFNDNIFEVFNLESDKNWTYNATFAEEGKKKEIATYFDGTTRKRQMVTRINTDAQAIIGNMYYDYEGRGVIQSLPTPDKSRNDELMFYEDFNLSGNNLSFGKNQYDLDDSGSICNPSSVTMSNASGASNYYSNQNPIQTGANAYLPDAELHPFSRQTYDNYGRVKHQSGVGATHNVEGDHATTTFYGEPSQGRLDRLFGNDVGYAKHYTMTAQKDANGQIVTTYANLSGKVIATSLRGQAPESLLPLDSNTGSATFTEELTDFNEYIASEYAYTISHNQFIDTPGEYTFQYILSPEVFEGLCNYNAQTGLDFPCQYDLIITITDACNSPVNDDLNILHQEIFNITGPADFDTTPFIVNFLNVGTYHIEKRLRLNQAALDTYLASYEAYLRDDSFDNGCVTPLQDLIDQQLAEIDWTNCDDCETFCANNPALCAAEGLDCNTLFNPNNLQNCDGLLDVFITDVSVGGQYFENLPDQNATTYDPNAWLINNIASDPSAFGFTTTSGDPITTWDDLRANWNPSFASNLVSYHPEYCHYQWCTLAESSEDFGMQLFNLDYAGAQAAGYINSAGNLFNYVVFGNDDPIETISTTVETIVYAELANYQSSGLDVWQYIITNTAITDPDERWMAFRSLYTAIRSNVLEDYKANVFGCGYLSASPELTPEGLPNLIAGNGFVINVLDILTIASNNNLDTTSGAITWGNVTANIAPTETCDFDDIHYDFETSGINPQSSGITYEIQFFIGSAPFYTNEVAISDPIDITGLSYGQIAIAATNALNAYNSSITLSTIASGNAILIDSIFSYGNINGQDVFYKLVQTNSGTATVISTDTYVLSRLQAKDCQPIAVADCFCTELEQTFEALTIDQITPNANAVHQAMAQGYNDLHGTSITASDVQLWLHNCEQNNNPGTDSNGGSIVPSIIQEANCDFEATPCEDDEESIALANHNALMIFEAQIDEQLALFRAAYIAHCMNTQNDANNLFNETFTMTGKDHEYHFMLYYYDNAGNLIRTIPPEGVKPITDAAQLAQVQAHRDDATVGAPVYPSHLFKTEYVYNTLNQLRTQNTPDGGTTNFWYDGVSRIVASQDARQKDFDTTDYPQYTNEGYSYTKYDGIGRVVEVGVVESDHNPTTAEVNHFNWPANFATSNKTEVTKSVYDKPIASHTPFATNELLYQRSRIASIYWYKGLNLNDSNIDDYQLASHYSYDEHGHVNSLINENKFLAYNGQDKKRIDYTYDLISGNVNAVAYQDGYSDAFHHNYYYDADNRIVEAYTSKDGHIWDKDARYFYYEHGPMSRDELGDEKVQGNDYAYTIHGWIKGINSNVLDTCLDMGSDGLVTTNPNSNLNFNIASDARAFTLSYYNNDFKSISGFNGDKFFSSINSISTGGVYNDNLGNELFNGNIRHMTTHMMDIYQTPIDLAATFYKYDQLQRIKSMDAFIADKNIGYNFTIATNNGDYHAEYSFDANGNLETLTRNSFTDNTNANPTLQHNNAMDNFTYTYQPETNKLLSIEDNGDNTNLNIDFGDIKNGRTYNYNSRGDLIEDPNEEIEKIDWYQNGKVRSITRTSGSEMPDFEFYYDGMGMRTIKIEKPRPNGNPSGPDAWIHTYYNRDAQGNPMAIYGHTFEATSGTLGILNVDETFTLKEHHIYGSERIALTNSNLPVYEGSFNHVPTIGFGKVKPFTNHQSVIDNSSIAYQSPTNDFSVERNKAKKYFELINHLGNVLAVVNDRKFLEEITNCDGITKLAYTPDVVSYKDYYPYGMEMPNRQGEASEYRYGYQRQEKDDEIKGKGNSINYKYRMHDPRIGRFFATDPLEPYYPWNSPYAFSENRINDRVELEGLETTVLISSKWFVGKIKAAAEVGNYAEVSRLVSRAMEENVAYIGKVDKYRKAFRLFESNNGKKTMFHQQAGRDYGPNHFATGADFKLEYQNYGRKKPFPYPTAVEEPPSPNAPDYYDPWEGGADAGNSGGRLSGQHGWENGGKQLFFGTIGIVTAPFTIAAGGIYTVVGSVSLANGVDDSVGSFTNDEGKSLLQQLTADTEYEQLASNVKVGATFISALTGGYQLWKMGVDGPTLIGTSNDLGSLVNTYLQSDSEK